MPLKLVPPRTGKSPNYSVRGTYLKQYVDRSAGTPDKRVARQVLDKIKASIEAGEFGAPAGPTFAEAVIHYIKAGGAGRRRKYIMGPLLDYFGERPLSQMNQLAIDMGAQALYPHASPATRNRQVYTPVSAVLKHAGIDHKLKRPQGSGGEQRTNWLWPKEAFRLFKEADVVDPRFGVFLRLLCYTGLRLSEALNLKWQDVALDEAFAYIPDTKSGDPRPVFLPPVVHAGLGTLERRIGTVFRLTKSARLYNLFREVKEAAGLPRLRLHDLRHTFATWMRRYGGLDTQGLVATGAWRDPASASRYSHTVFSEEAKKAALLPTEDE